MLFSHCFLMSFCVYGHICFYAIVVITFNFALIHYDQFWFPSQHISLKNCSTFFYGRVFVLSPNCCGIVHVIYNIICALFNTFNYKIIDLGQAESESLTICSCGKNKKRMSQASCQQREDKPSGCPCVKKNICCTRKCKCRNCNNLSKSTVPSTCTPLKLLRCRCGENTALKKDDSINVVSCRDGEKKSKCPCLGSGQGCSDLCRCFNCENVHGARLTTLLTKKRKK